MATQPYEDPVANPVPVFPGEAFVPDMPWKSSPVAGHLMGFVRDETGAIVDTGAVTIARDEGTDPPAGTRTTILGATDGGGFYGGVDLAPGAYRLTVTPVGQPAYTTACTTPVTAGQVGRFDITIDREGPTVVLEATPRRLWPPNHRTVDVTLAGAAEDTGTGIDTVSFHVRDEYGLVQPEVAPIAGGGRAQVAFSQAIPLEASRAGKDKNGRTYTLEVTVTDRACHARTATITVVVPHDQGH